MHPMSFQKQPLVSVLLPTYNAGSYLRSALESILRQTYVKFEIIVIDDGSTDNSLATITNISDKRIKFIQQENSGKAVALNRALDLIKGEFWLIQDADDLSHPDRIDKLLGALAANTKLAAVYSGHDLLLGECQFAPTTSLRTVEQCRNGIDNFRMPAHDATGMYRTELVGSLRFDPELRIGQGVDFALQTGELFPVCRLNQCLYTYRINYQSTIRRNPQENIKWINQVIMKACMRRGLDYTEHCLIDTTAKGKQSKTKLNHIVSHCMESVVDLKADCHDTMAIQTALTCLKVAPNKYTFYKPLIYSFLPLCLIKRYRKGKI